MTSVDRIQGLSGSLAVKAPVRVATTAAITLAGEQTIDGVAVVTGDRVLVKNQATSSANGIYAASTAGWTRAKDFDGKNDIVTGTLVTINAGTVNGDTSWRVTTTGTITIGTSLLTFSQAVFSGSGSVEFTQVGAGAVATTVQTKLRETFSVKDFGAVGNGVADDTTAIQATITAAQTAGNGEVFFPYGTYLVTSTITITQDNIHLRGAGITASTVKRTTDYGSTFSFAKAAAVGAYITGCSVSDLTIYSTIRPTTGAHIVAEYANLFTLFNLNLSDCNIGVQLKACFSVNAHDIYMRLSAGTPTSRAFFKIGTTTSAYAGVGNATIGSNIAIHDVDCASLYTIGGANAGSDYGIHVVGGVDGLWISNSYFGGCSAATLLINNNIAAPNYMSGITVLGCFFDAGQGGDILTQGSSAPGAGNFIFSNNLFGGGTEDTYGIQITGNFSDVNITNNVWYSGNKSDIVILGSSGNNFIVAGNQMSKGGVAGAGDGVKVTSGGLAVIAGNLISDTTFVNGVSLGASCSQVAVTSNVIVNCSTSGISIANGVTIFTIDGNQLHNNGTNLIDSSGDVSKLLDSNYGYNPIIPTSVTVNASPFTWKNTTGSPVVVIISGGTVSDIALQAITVAAGTNVSIVVPHAQSIVITSSSYPAMKYLGV